MSYSLKKYPKVKMPCFYMNHMCFEKANFGRCGALQKYMF